MAGELERGGPVACAATALAGWARYLAVVDPSEQAFDAAAGLARSHAQAATTDPRAFLDFAELFPAAVRDAPRFVTAFTDAYHCITEDGPLAAMERVVGRAPLGIPR